MEQFKRIVSWNVNGLRSVINKNFYEFLKDYKPDVLCLQETKIYDSVCPQIEEFKYTYFNHCTSRKGYSGTAVLSNIEPLSIRLLDVDKEHPEGRIIITEFKSFFLIKKYFQKSKNYHKKQPKTNKKFDKNIKKLVSIFSLLIN